MADNDYGFGRRYYEKGDHYSRLISPDHRCRNPWCFSWQGDRPHVPYPPPPGGGGDGGTDNPDQLTYSNVEDYGTSLYNYQGLPIVSGFSQL